MTQYDSSQTSRERYEGTVVWFNAGKGYGFIRANDESVNEGKDLFVHFHNIIRRGFKSLKKGDIVEFSLGKNNSGVSAHEVKIVKEVDGGEEQS